MPKILRL